MQRTRKLALFICAAAMATTPAMLGGSADAASDDQGKPTTRSAEPDPKFLAKERAAGRNVVRTATSRAALATLSKRVTTYVAENGTRYSFAVYAQPDTGTVVLQSDAPEAVTTRLTRTDGARELRGVAIRAGGEKIRDVYHRRDDSPPFWGGAGITDGNGICSTGYAVKNSAGTRFMTTAGHCFPDGAAVRTESGGHVVGTVVGRQLPTVNGQPKDMELIAGGSYAGRVYSGGVVSTTSNPVVAAGSAVVGYTNYCHSGRTTGENCGHTAVSTNATVCTGSGCKTNVIQFTGGVMIQGGDSGGTFYAKDASNGVWIRGHVIATNGVTGWAETWTKVASTYGVSIVTN
ncbi:MAG: hypothetical protein ACRCYQ_10390 [Nocardioides sp.]